MKTLMKNNINNRKENIITLISIIIIITGFFLIRSAYTGYATLEDNGSYTDMLNINITSNTSYIWEPEHKGDIDSIRLRGYLEGDYANVYVKKDNKSYLVYGYNIKNITAEAVEVSSGDNEINISFEYSNYSDYDADDNGIAHIEDIIDFSVNRSVFGFDANYSKLCTKYKVDNKELNTTVCYGYDECCLFMGLSPESENWDDIFYLNYGKYNAGYNNTVYAQVIYYDVNLDEDNLYSYIYNSGVLSLDAVFVDRVYFDDACVESCSLTGFDEDTYELVFEVDGIVYVDNISYGISSFVEDEIVSIRDKDKRKIGHYKLKNKTNGKYDLEISSLEKSLKGVMGLGKESKAKIKNIEKLKKLDVYIDEITDKEINTDVFAVNESLEFDYAEITLVKNGNVNAVMYCSDFDFDEFSCSDWEKTSIPFVDNGDTITFTVNHFSAYAGAEINVINVHSYPSLHGNWTVMFNTTGVANLTITATYDPDYTKEVTRWTNQEIECYDDETEILTENGWKYFRELENEKVMTLNPETHEKEWQLPTAKQVYEHDDEMYKIVLEDSSDSSETQGVSERAQKSSISDMLVSPEHKVYAGEKEENYNPNKFTSSFVERTITPVCFLSNLSFDQREQLSLSANEIKSISLRNSSLSSLEKFLESNFALSNIDLYSFNGINSTLCINSSRLLENSSREIFVFVNNSGIYFLISSRANSGENGRISGFDSIFSNTEFFQKNVNKTFESTTNLIYNKPLFFNSLSLPALDSLSDLTAHSLKGSSSLSFFNISSFQDSSLVFLSIDFLTNPDQLISEKDSILCLTASGTDNVMLTILNTSNYVKKHKYVKVFKPFDLKDYSYMKIKDFQLLNSLEFNIIPITEAYDYLNDDKELYFLDGNNNPVRVKSITKEDYKGKIYDVDVENDIVLVRRENKTSLWSGNSDNNSYDLQFLEIRCGDEVKQYEWQGSNCYENECSVFIEDYSCNETAYEVSKVLTAKRHVLKFSFGNETAYAYNDVSPLELDYMEYSSNASAQAAYVSSDAYTAIHNCTELQAMQNDLSGKYYLANDIDCTYDTQNASGALYNGGAGFEPVGTDANPFTGIFDGNEHTITGLKINRWSTYRVGLFGKTSGATIQDVGLIDCNIRGKDWTGALVGYNGATITNCYSTGVVSSSYGALGGLVGHGGGAMTNCYSTSTVSNGFANNVGGLVGDNYATLTDCYATGAVSGGNMQVGGLVGRGGTLIRCYATGDVSGNLYVGGLSGGATSPTNCYATGAVVGTTGASKGYAGGLIGFLSDRTATNCYSTGSVSGSNAGGLVALDVGATYNDCFWDTQTSGQGSSAGGTGKTTVQMKQEATFTNWNFSTIWNITENETYPFLQPI
ncbi:MAG: hypothetical protein KAU20_03000, partial [Nanoarchaeota archaeon]|nr:hypothetical protein [Nanoarchaeota archaeon]